MNVNYYQKLAMRTCSIPYEKKFDKLVHGVTGLMAEMLEAEQAKGKEHYIKELGDCTWMIAEICDSQNLMFYDVVTQAQHHEKADFTTAKIDLLSIVQKKYQGHEVDPDKVFNNVCVIMTQLISKMKKKSIDLNDVLEINIDKLKSRYPDGFEAERSLHRAEGDV